MKYNAKCNKWLTEGGLVFELDEKTGHLKLYEKANQRGYGVIHYKGKHYAIHRMIWETFRHEIPKSMEIDHIDGDKSNNSIDNLRCVTHIENVMNSNTVHKNRHPRKNHSVVYNMFTAHYGKEPYYLIDYKIYRKMVEFHRRNGYMKWEALDASDFRC